MAKFIPQMVVEINTQEVNNLKARLEKNKDIPMPLFFDTSWGYKKVLCPVCQCDTLIKGYMQHYRYKHLKNNYKPKEADAGRKKGSKSQPWQPKYEDNHNITDWQRRAKISHERIMKRYGKYNGKMIKERLK